jgi:hypothetical protein
VGSNALYGYEVLAGVHFHSEIIATGDLDVLLDTREQLRISVNEESPRFIELLKKPDKSFQISDRQTFRAINGVQPDMKVVVIAPFDASEEEIVRRVRKRAPWINRQLLFLLQFHPRTPAREYVSGETHRYLGRQYQLKVTKQDHDDETKPVRLFRGYIEVRSIDPDQPEITRQLADVWLKARAHKKFSERLEMCLKQFPSSEAYRPAGTVVRRMTKRWGSMTPAKRLNLNLELIRAPVAAIDYVITLELCPMKYDNHGPKFSALLERTMPDWERRKMKLERVLA